MLSQFGEEKKALGFFLCCCFSSFSYWLRECPLNKTSLTAQADRRGKINTACQLQLEVVCQLRSSVKHFTHGNSTTRPSGSANIQVSKQALLTCKKALEPCCGLSVSCHLATGELQGKNKHRCSLPFLLCLQEALLKTFSTLHLSG